MTERRHVFISYARDDTEWAVRLAQEILLGGHSVFTDRLIGIGEAWDKSIEAALEASYAVVTIWTPISTQKSWVRNESRYALTRGMLCPVFAENCELPIEFAHVQAQSLVKWNLSFPPPQIEFARLRSALNKLRGYDEIPDEGAGTEKAFRLGLAFLRGWHGAPKNRKIALHWLELAANDGHAEAQMLTKRLAELVDSENR